MTKRAATWLLAALLALSAGAAVPVVRAQTWSSNSAIVWIAQDHARQGILVRIRPHRPVRVRKAAAPRPEQPQAKVRLFAAFLYQRPPPFSPR